MAGHQMVQEDGSNTHSAVIFLASSQLIDVVKHSHTLVLQNIPIKCKAILPSIPNKNFN